MTSKNIFRCVIISPAGKLLDSRTSAVTFTAHDGSVGVLYNHMPMLCRLGLGIMEITAEQQSDIDHDNENNHKKLVLIDGGFAMVISNLVNIIAFGAVCGWDMNREKFENLLEKSRKKLSRQDYTPVQKLHETRKNVLLEKLFAAIK
jgi:F0F1-type ATP synthase epsilon subunit